MEQQLEKVVMWVGQRGPATTDMSEQPETYSCVRCLGAHVAKGKSACELSPVEQQLQKVVMPVGQRGRTTCTHVLAWARVHKWATSRKHCKQSCVTLSSIAKHQAGRVPARGHVTAVLSHEGLEPAYAWATLGAAQEEEPACATPQQPSSRKRCAPNSVKRLFASHRWMRSSMG